MRVYSRLALERFMANDEEGARIAVALASFYANNGQVTAEQLLLIRTEAQETMREVGRALPGKGLPHRDTLTISEPHDIEVVYPLVGSSETHRIGFAVKANLRGERYVVAQIGNDRIYTEIPLLDASLVPHAEAYMAEGRREGGLPELTAGYGVLFRTLESRMASS